MYRARLGDRISAWDRVSARDRASAREFVPPGETAVGFNNPPIPWRELERQLTWRKAGQGAPPATRQGGGEGDGREEAPGQPVIRLPVPAGEPA